MNARLDQVSRAFALLIGINDYSTHDTSAGLPAGANDLPAGRNDVGAFYRMCRALGVPHENIHILTSPKLAPGDFGEPGEQIPCGHLGEATGAEIRAQLAWLAGALAHGPGDTDAPIGLLTYSGHGDLAGDHLALCPSDVRAGAGAAADLDGALGFPEIQTILRATPGGCDNLTVVLDCCHAAAAAGADAAVSGASSKRRAGRSLTGRARRSDAGAPVLLGQRMLMAAEPGQVAFQSKFAGVDHGALTWALNVVTDQFEVESEGDVDHFTLDHGTLHELAQGLLRTLDFEQTIVLYPEGAAHLLFFHRGQADASDVAAKEPDRERHPIQLDPNLLGGDYTLYELTVKYIPSGGEEITAHAQVLSVGKASDATLDYRTGEHWWFGTHFAAAFASSSSSVSLVFSPPTTGTWGPATRQTLPAGWNGNNTTTPKPSSVEWPRSSGSPASNTVFTTPMTYGLHVSQSTPPTVTWYVSGPTSSHPPTGMYVPTWLPLAAANAPTLPATLQWYSPGSQ